MLEPKDWTERFKTLVDLNPHADKKKIRKQIKKALFVNVAVGAANEFTALVTAKLRKI